MAAPASRAPGLAPNAPITSDGWLRTGDRIRLHGDRALFAGRADNVVNVAGLKVSPEEVEEYLLTLPGIADASVRPVPSPLTGYLLSANVVFQDSADQQAALHKIRAACHRDLPPHKIPRQFHAVSQVPASLAGKKL
jgi:acyl-coenzyme A synthetase/AMP-(fatty) acid ligase